MHDLADRLLSARRRGWLRSRPVFENSGLVSEDDLAALEQRVCCLLPPDLKAWLSLAGYGDIDQTFSIRNEWFQPVRNGELKGGCRFAQDELGNFYAFGPAHERLMFFSRSEPGYAVLAPSFQEFLTELERRNFKILEWVDSVKLSPYTWSAV